MIRNLLYIFCSLILIIVAAFSGYYYFFNPIAKLIILSSLFFLLFTLGALFVSNKFFFRMQRVGTFIAIIYLLCEITTWFLLSCGLIRKDMGSFFKSASVTNAPLCFYDSICGYRAVSEKKRYLAMNNGKIEIDHPVYVNKAGWYSTQEYFFKKQSKKVKRYMVLGDSYSSGLVVENTWVDEVQKQFFLAGDSSVEFYNFSLDGAGIQNWYRLFFQEIASNYDFDGVIIANSSEKESFPTLDRKFIMANTVENITYMAISDITTSRMSDRFPILEAVPVSYVYENNEIDRIKEDNLSRRGLKTYKLVNIGFNFLSILYNLSDGVCRFRNFSKKMATYRAPFLYYENLSESFEYNDSVFRKRYEYGFMFDSLIQYNLDHDKRVILINIPDYNQGVEFANGKNCIYIREQKYLAEKFNLVHINGFCIFKNKSKDFVKSCFYEYDRHWNAKGSSLFAKYFYDSFIVYSRKWKENR